MANLCNLVQRFQKPPKSGRESRAPRTSRARIGQEARFGRSPLRSPFFDLPSISPFDLGAPNSIQICFEFGTLVGGGVARPMAVESPLLHSALHSVITFLASLPSLNVTALDIDIGTSLDPMLPPSHNTSIAVLGFEPVRYEALATIYQSKLNSSGLDSRVHLSRAAIGRDEGEATMGIYHKHGAASSLSEPVSAQRLSKVTRDEFSSPKQTMITVPVLSLRTVLDSVPESVEVQLLKTDMQGHDFAALLSAGDLRQANASHSN